MSVSHKIRKCFLKSLLLECFGNRATKTYNFFFLTCLDRLSKLSTLYTFVGPYSATTFGSTDCCDTLVTQGLAITHPSSLSNMKLPPWTSKDSLIPTVIGIVTRPHFKWTSWISKQNVFNSATCILAQSFMYLTEYRREGHHPISVTVRHQYLWERW